MKNVTPPLQYPRIVEEQGQGATLAAAAALAALAGAAAGAAAMLTRNLGLSHEAAEAKRAKDAGGSSAERGVRPWTAAAHS